MFCQRIVFTALLFLSNALALPSSKTGCVKTTFFFSTNLKAVKTVPTYTVLPFAFVTSSVTKFIPTTTVTTSTTTTVSIYTSTSVIPSSTLTVTKTKTAGLTKTYTTSCPTCDDPTSTTTISYIFTTSTKYLKTVTSTSTYAFHTTTVHPSTTTTRISVTFGNPPTTTRSTSTITQSTVLKTFLRHIYQTKRITRVTTGLATTTTTVTVTAAAPTASITLKLFSLQDFNFHPIDDDQDYANYNGSTIAGNGANGALVPQTSVVVQYFVSPATGRLIEYSTGRHFEYTCGDPGCNPREGIVLAPDGVNPTVTADGGETHLYQGALYNCVADCGKPLRCGYSYFQITQYNFDYVETHGGDFNGQGPYDRGDAIFVVGPTKGYVQK